MSEGMAKLGGLLCVGILVVMVINANSATAAAVGNALGVILLLGFIALICYFIYMKLPRSK